MINEARSEVENPKSETGDYDFIIRIIQYLEYNFKIRFFITSRDFDILYRWWERRMPIRLIMESISRVVERRRSQGREIRGFSTFSYEVKKNFKSSLELKVGDSQRQEKGEYFEIEQFLHHYPQELSELKNEFEKNFERLKNNQNFSLENIHERLLEMFQHDRDLNLKTRFFLGSIAKELQKPEIEKRYRINYLCHKFKIPDFEIHH